MRIRVYLSILPVLLLCSALKPAQAQITIETSDATHWKIANGAISMDWDSTSGSLWSTYLYPSSSRARKHRTLTLPHCCRTSTR